MEDITLLVKKELALENATEATSNAVIAGLGEEILARSIALILIKDTEGEVERLVEQGELAQAFTYALRTFPYVEELLENIAQEVILEYKSAA